MTDADAWTIAKDAAGFGGALLLFLPWIRDYLRRARLERLKSVPTQLDLKARLRQRHETWLARPKKKDLLSSLFGMGLITFSFGISLLISLKILPGSS